jgi:enoyl-CoA hydratase
VAHHIINYQKIDHITIISIRDPLKEAFELDRISWELRELHRDISRDKETKVVILTGAGEKSFSIDIDLVNMVPRPKEEGPTRFWRLAATIAEVDRLFIAAVNGDATGLGLELILACDIRISAEASRFGFPHIAKGMMPWDGGTQRLPRTVGRAKAMEMLLTGELVDAREAYRIGLINRIVPAEELVTTVMRLAQDMASKSPISLQYSKEAIVKGMDLTLEQGLCLEADLYFLMHTTHDREEGIRAFREKRKPHFDGT